MDLRSWASFEFLNLTVRDVKDAGSTSAFWFAVDGDRAVTVLTDRRIAAALREDPEITVSFSDQRGDSDAPRFPAIARRLTGAAAQQATALLNDKYGWRRRSFRFVFWFTRRLGSTWDHEDHVFEVCVTASDDEHESRVPRIETTRRSPVSEVEVAGVVVNASKTKHALDHLTEVAVPLGLRIEVERDLVRFSFHDPELGWWATTTCRGVASDPSTASASAALTVPRLVFREAIELVQLDPAANTVLVVHEGESVHVGATAVSAAQSWPEIPAPPSTGSEPDLGTVALPAGPFEPDEKVSFTAGDLHLTAMGAALERFAARDIHTVGLLVGDTGAALVGATHEAAPDDRLVLAVSAHVDP